MKKRILSTFKIMFLSIYLIIIFLLLGIFYLTGIPLLYWIVTGNSITKFMDMYIIKNINIE